MELLTVQTRQLHFPREEWRWLRPDASFSPDFAGWPFLLGVKEEKGTLWAWHPRGGGILDCPTEASVPVLVLASGVSEIEAFGLWLKTSFFAEKGSDPEWVAALQVLRDRFHWDLATQELPPHWAGALQACGLSPHKGILAARERFLSLSHAELALLFTRRWDLATFELIETLAPPVRAAFLQALARFNLSANHSKECLNQALILSRKIGEKAAITVLTASSPRNAEEFRMLLANTSQPALANLSQKRLQLLRALRMPPRTTVFGDPSFESDAIKITHTPKSLGDFEVFKTWMNDPETQARLKELLEVYQ